MCKCSIRPKWAVEWLGGSFLGQDNISLIRKLAASSDPEDPGCSRTHTRLHWLPPGLTHFPSLWTCSGGCGASRWDPPGAEDSVDQQEQRTAWTTRKEERGTETAVACVLKAADPESGTQGEGDTAERRPPPPPHSPLTPLENSTSGRLEERAHTRAHTRRRLTRTWGKCVWTRFGDA